MDGLSINGQLILEETEHTPTDEEVNDYARIIGIDPEKEPNLMHIAKDGIEAPLPMNWKACSDIGGEMYYFNFSTGESLWDHPMDKHFKDLVVKERTKLEKLIHEDDGFIEVVGSVPRESTVDSGDLNRLISKSYGGKAVASVGKQDLQIIPDSKTKQFYNDADLSDSSEHQSDYNCAMTDSPSEDYAREVNFGLDKSLTDRLSKNGAVIETRETMKPAPLESLSNTNKTLRDTLELLPLEESQEEITEQKEELERQKLRHELDSFMNAETSKYEREKDDIVQRLREELDEFEKTERSKCKTDFDKRLKGLKENFDRDFVTEKIKLQNNHTKDIEKVRERLRGDMKKCVEEIEKTLDCKPLQLSRRNFDNVKRELSQKFEEKIKSINDDHQKKLNEMIEKTESELESLKSTWKTEKEQLLLKKKKELSDLSQENDKTRERLQEDKLRLESELKTLLDRGEERRTVTQEKIKEQSQLMSSLQKNPHNESKVRSSKAELGRLKTEIMERKSELATLQNELDRMQQEKMVLLRNRSQHKDLFDDAGVSMSYDNNHHSHEGLDETTTITHPACSAVQSTTQDRLILKAKTFLSRASRTEVPQSNLSRSLSLPTLLEPLQSRLAVSQQQLTADCFLDSLQKITSDLNHIVFSLRSTQPASVTRTKVSPRPASSLQAALCSGSTDEKLRRHKHWLHNFKMSNLLDPHP